MAKGNIIIKKATWKDDCVISGPNTIYTGYKIWDTYFNDDHYIGRVHKELTGRHRPEWHAEPPEGKGEYEIGFHNRKAAIGYLLVQVNESH